MTILRRKLAPLFPAALLVAALAACADDDPLGPEDVERADVVGTYDATTLLATEGGTTINLMLTGADLEITLAADGTTSGHLLVPGMDEDGGDLDASLAGTYSFDDASRQVTFEQEADTFLRDLALTAVRSGSRIRLEGTETFGTATVEVVLTRR